MSIELNHTIVAARDPQASAQFLAGILGLQVEPPLAHFTPVTRARTPSSRATTRSWPATRSSTPHSLASRMPASPTSPTPHAGKPGRSISATATAAGVCTSATPTATSWRSSPGLPVSEFHGRSAPLPQAADQRRHLRCLQAGARKAAAGPGGQPGAARLLWPSVRLSSISRWGPWESCWPSGSRPRSDRAPYPIDEEHRMHVHISQSAGGVLKSEAAGSDRRGRHPDSADRCPGS